MDTFTIQVPDGWLQMTRADYEAHLLPKNSNLPRLLTATQMEEATSISARRWIDMANRNAIPFVDLGERSYRFDFMKVYQHLRVPAETTSAEPMQRSMREFMDSVDERL